MADREGPAEIERDIEERREDLARTLDALQDRAAPERLARTGVDLLGRHGQQLAAAAMRQARRNPLAAAMVVGGLAWLAFGPDLIDETARPRRRDAPRGRTAPMRPARAAYRPPAPRDPVPGGPAPGRGTGHVATGAPARPGAGRPGPGAEPFRTRGDATRQTEAGPRLASGQPARG